MRRLSGIAILALVVMIPACAKHKPVFQVKGRVLDSNGKPAAGATVVFHPTVADPKDKDIAKPTAQVDADGNFNLTTYKTGDGAPQGEYNVTVFWPAPKKNPFDAVGADQLKGAFADPKTSKIKFTVEKKDLNEVPPIKVPAPSA